MSDLDERAATLGARFTAAVQGFNLAAGRSSVQPLPPLPPDPSGYDRERHAVAVLGRRLLDRIDEVEPLQRPAAAPRATRDPTEPCPTCGGKGWTEVKVIGAGGSFSGIGYDHDTYEHRPCPACQFVVTAPSSESPEAKCAELWAAFIAQALPEAAAQAGHAISEETLGFYEERLCGVLKHLLRLRLSGEPLAADVRQVAVALLNGEFL